MGEGVNGGAEVYKYKTHTDQKRKYEALGHNAVSKNSRKFLIKKPSATTEATVLPHRANLYTGRPKHNILQFWLYYFEAILSLFITKLIPKQLNLQLRLQLFLGLHFPE